MTGARADPVVVRWLWLGLVCAIVTAWPRRAPPWQGDGEGGQLARLGCLDPATAAIEDLRAVPGVGRAVAARLVDHCRSRSCRRGEPVAGVAGVGPVLGARLARLWCPVGSVPVRRPLTGSPK